MLEPFLLGVIFTMSIIAAVYFLKFWRKTHDRLFLAFGAAFLIEGFNRLGFLFLEDPSEGSPTIYTIRLMAFLLVLVAILSKNRPGGTPR
jgi:hypothetical protein